MERIIFNWALILSLAFFSTFSIASDKHPLDKPRTSVLLKISGKIKKTNADNIALFDLEMLRDLQIYTLETHTPWQDKPQKYQGILLRDLLNLVGADKNSSLYTRALNDYDVSIPAEMIEKYSLMLIFNQDNQPIKIRDKGPLRILSSFEDYPELRKNSRYMIWHLNEIEVR
ncbi:hypothetical protein [Oceanospirillum sediminis]|uniref:Oxidoreductase molybdopterin-binding domain-containing protein n=1 Tax=Oceanospirillum sediminis TaxID=2760088 RepID=A0A839IXD2_9GAMM|nr:hypothetical protein [Oceanospirillum sediminis]MBB1489109.1 hypothetical protein [Oceanospirillum sediminis]